MAGPGVGRSIDFEIMQFNSDSDFPAADLPASQWAQVARPPLPFEPADFVPCACITTRVLLAAANNSPRGAGDDCDAEHVLVGGASYVVKTAKGVLVRTPTPQNAMQGGGGAWSDSDDSDVGMNSDAPPAAQHATVPMHHTQDNNNAMNNGGVVERAYWLQRTLRAAIYGKVRYGIVLRKLSPPVQVMLPASSKWVSVEWEETNEAVAVKEMSWEHIRTLRDKLAEDPMKEIAAMQYLGKWLQDEHKRECTVRIMQQLGLAGGNNADVSTQLAAMNISNLPLSMSNGMGVNAGQSGGNQWMDPQQQHMQLPQAALALQNAFPSQLNFLESHIMMPLDLLTDDRHLYSVMPYCSGGELFDVLETKNRFSEPEARFWMRQILKGLSCLKKAGVSHRDLSLENLLVHEGNVLVIDMGM